MKMKKELGFLEVFSIASGAMISSGLFLLPAILYAKVGPGVILSYILASLLVIPTIFSSLELSTAMPKAGGAYFFIQKSLGSFIGTFAGFASWLSLCLKSAFALVGIGIFLSPFISETINLMLLVKLIAIIATVFFTIINIVSVKNSGRFQVILVILLLCILIIYALVGVDKINVHRFTPFIPFGIGRVFTVTGMVFVSFAGLTKIVSMAEEVKEPEKNLPKAMFASFFVVTSLYVLLIFITIGILTEAEFANSAIPFLVAAKKYAGNIGYIAISLAAMLAFITTGNAGLMAASRSPLAMAEDNLLPSFFGEISPKYRTPGKSIVVTAMIMIFLIAFLNIENLVKVASTMQLILFILSNASVILMRESKIVSYKPTFKTFFYPYLQIFGIIVYFFLIIEMGDLTLFMTLIFFGMSTIWYFMYSKKSGEKESALIHIVERLTSKKIRSSKLTNELMEIWKERNGITEDRFDEIIKKADILDLDEKMDIDDFFEFISKKMSINLGMESVKLYDLLIERENESSTILKKGFALPHIIINGDNKFEMLLIRAKNGINFKKERENVKIIFVIAGSADERNFHLKALMSIAQIVSEEKFEERWLNAKDITELKNIILLSNRKRG